VTSESDGTENMNKAVRLLAAIDHPTRCETTALTCHKNSRLTDKKVKRTREKCHALGRLAVLSLMYASVHMIMFGYKQVCRANCI